MTTVAEVLTAPTAVRDMRRLASVARKRGAVEELRSILFRHIERQAVDSFAKANELLRSRLPDGPALLISLRDNAILSPHECANIERYLEDGIAKETTRLSGILVTRFDLEPMAWARAMAVIMQAKLNSPLAGALEGRVVIGLGAVRLKVHVSKVLASNDPAHLLDVLGTAAADFVGKPTERKQVQRALELLKGRQ